MWANLDHGADFGIGEVAPRRSLALLQMRRPIFDDNGRSASRVATAFAADVTQLDNGVGSPMRQCARRPLRQEH
jgi:hypothetical protein